MIQLPKQILNGRIFFFKKKDDPSLILIYFFLFLLFICFYFLNIENKKEEKCFHLVFKI